MPDDRSTTPDPARALEVVVLVGLPGAGKSTFYGARYADTHALVSKDLMRSTRDRAARQAREIAAALSAGRSVVVDNTSTTPAERAPILGLARAHGARAVAVVFPPDVRACLERNARRSGRARVPDVAIHVMARRFVAPTAAEGFDEIREVVPVGGGAFVVEPAPAGPADERRG